MSHLFNTTQPMQPMPPMPPTHTTPPPAWAPERCVLIFDVDMADANGRIAQTLQSYGIQFEGVCANRPGVKRRILADQRFAVRSVPTILAMWRDAPGVVDKYETPEHHSFFFSKLAAMAGAEKTVASSSIADLPPENDKKSMRGGAKTRRSATRTRDSGRTVYDDIASGSGGGKTRGNTDISALVEQYNDDADRGMFEATPPTQRGQRGQRGHIAHIDQRGNIAHPEPHARLDGGGDDGHDEMFPPGGGNSGGVDYGDDDEGNTTDDGDITGGGDSIDDLVRLRNAQIGSPSSREDTMKKSRAQRARSDAIGSVASRMIKEREQSEAMMDRRPAHLR